MSDLIDRQAAIDTLDKHLQTTDVPVSYPGIISALTEWLNELPSAQADSKETSSTHKALDTISRKAAIEIASGFCHPANIAKELAKLPSAQPEIIRCKECKHQVKEWRTDKRFKNKGYMVCGCDVVGDACGYWALLGQDDDYCSKAERKEQNVENS